jgi:hypothetical protein
VIEKIIREELDKVNNFFDSKICNCKEKCMGIVGRYNCKKRISERIAFSISQKRDATLESDRAPAPEQPLNLTVQAPAICGEYGYFSCNNKCVNYHTSICTLSYEVLECIEEAAEIGSLVF